MASTETTSAVLDALATNLGATAAEVAAAAGLGAPSRPRPSPARRGRWATPRAPPGLGRSCAVRHPRHGDTPRPPDGRSNRASRARSLQQARNAAAPRHRRRGPRLADRRRVPQHRRNRMRAPSLALRSCFSDLASLGRNRHPKEPPVDYASPSPLDALETAFQSLVQPPRPLALDGRRLPRAVPRRPIPLDELRGLLLHPSTPWAARDAAMQRWFDGRRAANPHGGWAWLESFFPGCGASPGTWPGTSPQIRPTSTPRSWPASLTSWMASRWPVGGWRPGCWPGLGATDGG